MSKGSTAISAVVVIATGGYFAHDYYQTQKKEKEDKAARSASSRSRPAGSANGGPADQPTDTAAGNPGEAEASTHRARELKVPDLVGLTPEKATAKLLALGFSSDTLQIPADYGCTYEDEQRDIVPVGTICNQDRTPGQTLMSNAKLRVVVEHDTWEAGGKQANREWRRMPDLVGMELGQAKTLLRGKGFGDDEFVIGEAMSSCGRGIVCEQRPKKDTRKYATDSGELMIGQ